MSVRTTIFRLHVTWFVGQMRRVVLCRRSVACWLLVLLALQAGAESRRYQLCNRDLVRQLLSVCNLHKRSHPVVATPLVSASRLTSHMQRKSIPDVDNHQSSGWRRKRSSRDFQRSRRNANEHLNALNLLCCTVGCTELEMRQGCPYLRF